MGQIIYSPYMVSKLIDLSKILYIKGYFGSQTSADTYVERIRDFIKTIPNQPLKLCKTPKYGKYYAHYKNKSSGFSYYITFDAMDNIFYIENIISPKTKAYLAIKGLK